MRERRDGEARLVIKSGECLHVFGFISYFAAIRYCSLNVLLIAALKRKSIHNIIIFIHNQDLDRMKQKNVFRVILMICKEESFCNRHTYKEVLLIRELFISRYLIGPEWRSHDNEIEATCERIRLVVIFLSKHGSSV